MRASRATSKELRKNGAPVPPPSQALNEKNLNGGSAQLHRVPGDRVGLMGKIADTFNEIGAANERMAKQLDRVGQVVGRDGKTRQRVKLSLSSGAWGEMETSINTLIDDLLWPTTEVTRAIAAVAQGDLLQ